MIVYTSEVPERFFNPRNPGEIEKADGVGISGNARERNFMRMTITVADDKILDVRFKSYTCPVAVAACSMVTELAKQKALTEAMSISAEFVASQLGEVPRERMDRCVLAVVALRNAIGDFLGKRASPLRDM